MCIECGCGEDTGLTCPECGGRVVLIDNQATCLECGAIRAEHQGPHPHPNERGPHEETRPDDLTQLRVLLTCWMVHNEGLVHSLRRWAARAGEIGLDETARQIEEAAAHIVVCNQGLEAVSHSLENLLSG